MYDDIQIERTFAETISHLRRKNKFTKKEVAEYVGCSQTYIADIEKSKIPRDTIIVKLAELFKYNKKKLLFLAKREATVPEAKDLFKVRKEIYERVIINDYFLTILTFSEKDILKSDIPIMDYNSKIELSKNIWGQIDIKYKAIAQRPHFISSIEEIRLSDYLNYSKKSDMEIIDILKEFVEKIEYDINNNEVRVQIKEKKEVPFDNNVEPAMLGNLINIPLLTWVQAGEMTGYDDKYPYPGCSDEYITTDLKGAHLFALRVKGDSMSPKFLEDDIVIVNPDANVESGDFIIVKNKESHETMLKQFRKYSNNLVVLHPLNPAYQDMEVNENHMIIGRVVRKQTNL